MTAVPSDEAQTLFGALTGVPVGSARLHTVTKHVAEGLTGSEVAPSRDELARRSAAVAPGRRRRPVGGLGSAGAFVPTRPDSARERRPGRRGQRATRAGWRGQWRDAQGLRCSLLDGERLVHLLRWHPGHKEEPRGAALTHVKAAGVMPEAQGRLGVVCEGAEWRWQHGQALVPQARQGLDDYPCAPYRHHVAQAPSGASGQAWKGVEATMSRLSLGTVGLVLAGVPRMRAQAEEAANAMANWWDSRAEHRGRTTDQK